MHACSTAGFFLSAVRFFGSEATSRFCWSTTTNYPESRRQSTEGSLLKLWSQIQSVFAQLCHFCQKSRVMFSKILSDLKPVWNQDLTAEILEWSLGGAWSFFSRPNLFKQKTGPHWKSDTHDFVNLVLSCSFSTSAMFYCFVIVRTFFTCVAQGGRLKPQSCCRRQKA